jgi:hypothetical protein
MKVMRPSLFVAALFHTVVAAAALAPSGCGGSNSSLSKARSTQYQISMADLLDIAVQITKPRYTIATMAADGFITEGKWYNAQGASENRGGEEVNIKDGSISVAIMVQVSRTDNGFSSISVKTIAKKHITGMSALQNYDDDDISKPGWIDGKAEALAEEIAAAAKKYEAGPAVGGDSGAPGQATPAPVDPAPATPAN